MITSEGVEFYGLYSFMGDMKEDEDFVFEYSKRSEFGCFLLRRAARTTLGTAPRRVDSESFQGFRVPPIPGSENT